MITSPVALLMALLTMIVAPAPIAAQAPATPSEIDAIKSDLGRIRSEVESLKRQLAEVLRAVQQRQVQDAPTLPAGRARASLTDAPMIGRPDAPLTLVEFSDYQCPFCRAFFFDTFPTLKRDYIDAGKLRYVFRDYPLDQIHAQARRAAEAAHCAGEQGKYWEMHDVLFQNQRALSPEQVSGHARELGLNTAMFDACLDAGKYTALVSKGRTAGIEAGVQGTPGFVLAKTQTGDIVEGTPIRGAQPLDVFRKLIDQLLAEN